MLILDAENVVNFDKDLATEANFDEEDWRESILNSVIDDTISDDDHDDDDQFNDVVIDSTENKKETKLSEIHRMIGDIRLYLVNNNPSLCKEFMTFEMFS
ncbi:hypothetical protein BpHYR1_049132 [Brachionus plicatilis]|uniref:Uncharacterized protein n=1 Tax=Brachionus plicatilis TaxID=10195 RepID=A0A3M7SKK5_BRAPC|nr:hypothetical protein BpHYR1_049132 [Brachionus plicatilis]